LLKRPIQVFTQGVEVEAADPPAVVGEHLTMVVVECSKLEVAVGYQQTVARAH